MAKLILFNKPYDVLCQFRDNSGRTTLADFIADKNVYPAGRLDLDSEGLLLLTDNGALQHQISHPCNKLSKTYWAQVEGAPTAKAMNALRQGVILKDGLTRPARVEFITPPELWPRSNPVRQRKNIPTQWLAITINEGRNRQVRRMTASVGHPTLRLIRVRIGDWQLGALLPGQFSRRVIPMPALTKAATTKINSGPTAKPKAHTNPAMAGPQKHPKQKRSRP